MLRSSRTHALALAAFVLFAGGAAGARQYLNSGSPPGSVSMGVVPEVNDAAVSDANPLPVKVPGGGSVTAPGTSGSQAQAVQGISGGVPVGVSATSLPLPIGAASAAKQDVEIGSLATIAQRAVIYNDAANTAVAANTLQSFTLHDLGSAPAYSKTNAVFFSSVSGTAQLLQCQDSGCAIAFIVSSQVVSAGQFTTLTAPAFARYYRAAFQAGGTAGTVSVSVSATAN